jgi:arginyl-tRNA synthetase
MKWLHHAIAHHFPGIAFDVLPTPDEKLGDYSANIAFALAKQEKKNPFEVAQEVAGKFEGSEFFDKVEAVRPGFVNFYLKKEFLQGQLAKIHEHRDHFGERDLGEGKTVIVEYCGTNIAKPMHIGHLRSTIIGDALANVYAMLGYKVIRWNYLGDWGTQFGKLIAAYKMWGDKGELEEEPIATMLKLYVKFHDELKDNPDVEKQGQEEFKKLEEGDTENRGLWDMFRQYSLEEFESNYRQLGIRFDVTRGESAYESAIAEVIELLEEKNLLKQSEGAEIVELGDLPPALIRKSDGASLYITRDIASLKDRIEAHHPEKILYVVANQQALHFEQLFTIAQLLGLTASELTHVKFGMVLGEDGKKLATREGKVVVLQEVVDKITDLAHAVVKEKNRELSSEEAKTVAQAVGIGALKYNDLKQHPYSDITFDWDAMLDFSGNSGPYLQYTYARLMNILAKAEGRGAGDASLLNESEERRIMKHLMEFPASIEKCAELSTLNALALYLYELANNANRFYEAIRILDDENKQRRDARLMLIEATAVVLKRGLGLLGIQTLNRI